MTLCRVFALCDRPAVGTIDHSILGRVPSCQRCADRLEQELTPYPTTAIDNSGLTRSFDASFVGPGLALIGGFR
jgi:hypothetical protein